MQNVSDDLGLDCISPSALIRADDGSVQSQYLQQLFVLGKPLVSTTDRWVRETSLSSRTRFTYVLSSDRELGAQWGSMTGKDLR